MSGRFTPKLFSASATIHQIFEETFFDESDSFALHSFSVKWRSRLRRMPAVIGDIYLVCEYFLALLVQQGRNFVQVARCAEVIPEKAKQIQNSRRFKNNPILTRIDLNCVLAAK